MPASNQRLFWVDVHHACYGILSSDGVVVDAPPIAAWMIGKTLASLKPYLIRKKARVIEIF